MRFATFAVKVIDWHIDFVWDDAVLTSLQRLLQFLKNFRFFINQFMCVVVNNAYLEFREGKTHLPCK